MSLWLLCLLDQLLGGTRGEIDFVEMPSHLMEYMAWDARILKLFAKHWETGETISDALITKLRGSKNLFFGLDVLIQLKQALLDQRLHGPKTVLTISHNIYHLFVSLIAGRVQ